MRRRSLIIDLTTLLDVILIILFMVLVSVNNRTVKATDDLTARNSELLQEVKDLKKTQIPGSEAERNWQVVYSDQIGKVDLNFPDDLKTGAVKLLNSAGEEVVKPQTDDFRKWLIDEIGKLPQDVVILSFQYRNDAIYYKDYQEIREILLSLSQATGKKVLYEEFLK